MLVTNEGIVESRIHLFFYTTYKIPTGRNFRCVITGIADCKSDYKF